MGRSSSFAMLAVFAMVGSASADIPPAFDPNFSGGPNADMGGDDADTAWGDPRNNESAVGYHDRSSLSLYMYVDQGLGGYVNSGAEVSVERNAGFTPMGSTPGGRDTIVGAWEEIIGDDSNTVQVVWKTLGGGEFIPDGTKLNGRSVHFIGWRFGASDAVDFRSWVDSVELISVTVGYSIDSGESVNYFDITPAFEDSWDGTDIGKTLPLFIADGVNFITTFYEFRAIPAPAGAPLLALAAVAVARRRR